MGAGKSTYVESGFISGVVADLAADPNILVSDDATPVLNVDERAHTLEVKESAGRLAWVKAAVEVELILDWHINSRKSIGVESVISSDKYKERFLKAKSNSFYTILIYVSPPSLEIAKKRVHERAAAGAHGADMSTFDSNWEASLRNFAWFFQEADLTFLFESTDNEAASLLLQGNAHSQPVQSIRHDNPALRIALEAAKHAKESKNLYDHLF
ncbi:MAG: hypothetical protein Kilf2KO_34930 [Rhodospirillales bacterium]